MFYIIYQTTNIINSKIYIGKHQTKNLDDGYLGSGRAFGSALKKYGKENFKREILFFCSSEKELNAKEAEIITEEFTKLPSNYNIMPGGQGGFTFVNSSGQNGASKRLELLQDPEWKTFWDTQRKAGVAAMSKESITTQKQRRVATLVERYGTAGIKSFLGRTHTEESLAKQQTTFAAIGHSQGTKNSQYGSMWITNGSINKKISKLDIVPEGWYNGRVI